MLNWKSLKPLLLLNLFWLAISLLRSGSETLMFNLGDKVFSSFSTSEIFSLPLILGMTGFLLSSVAIYLLHAIVVWLLASHFSHKNQFSENGYGLVLMITWASSVYIIFFTNNLMFLHSLFNHSESLLFTGNLGMGLLLISSFWLLLLISLSLKSLLLLLISKLKILIELWRSWFKTVSVMSLVLITSLGVTFYHDDMSAKAKSSIPNIILIGVDSMRPDYVYNDELEDVRVPNIRSFLANTVRFENAVTPIARTFPSWISILTGKNPPAHGARVNLIDPINVKANQTISSYLEDAGYYTVYGMDERRFSNMDERYGFDKIAGPKTGVMDFILGQFNDTPLNNLIVNTTLGKWLFPYTFANRAAMNTYMPESFDGLILDELDKIADQQTPFMLSVHYCLPHWPFKWADSEEGYLEEITGYRKSVYSASLNRVDEQFGKLVDGLKQRGLLDNSLVVLLSDHGEGFGVISEFEESGDHLGKITPLHMFSAMPDWGHGTSLLSSSQNHVVLAMQYFGDHPFKPGIVQQRVSLIDIAPTITDFLSLDVPLEQFDGISLLPKLNDPGFVLPQRSFAFESGFSMEALLTANPNVEDVFEEGTRHYRINNSDGLLMIKQESLDDIIRKKQRSILNGDWMLLHVNPDDPDKQPYVGMFNISEHIWTRDMKLAQKWGAPVETLFEDMKTVFGEEITTSYF